jgi:glycosyltransferase involved in cell wall biosynthesis
VSAHVRFVVPRGIDDPARPSGGNAYDRRIRDGLRARGWVVHDVVATERLGSDLGLLPDGALVLVDGLVASAAARVLVPAADRLRIVVLVHMPLGGVEVPEDDEARVLASAAAVVTTSAWTRDLLLDRYGLPPERVAVARPGADLLEEAPGTPDGGRFLCVGAVAEHKGQDVLIEALARIADLPWTCTVVGSLDREPSFAERLRRRAAACGLADRIGFPGALAGEALAGRYRDSDLLVLPSRLEAYGMVVTEALGAGLPVVAATVGGVAEALGRTSSGRVPGRLVPPDDPAALADVLGGWLRDAGLRARLRESARERRRTLEGWDETVASVAAALVGVRAPALGARP